MIDTLVIEVMLSIMSLIGMAGVSRHEFRFFGFVICAAANILWIIFSLMTWHVAYLLLFSGYLLFNSIGVHDEYATWAKIRNAKRTIYQKT